MGFDWEGILDADGGDLGSTYEDSVYDATWGHDGRARGSSGGDDVFLDDDADGFFIETDDENENGELGDEPVF